MTDEDGRPPDSVAGQPVDEAVDAVLARGVDEDRETVRAALSEAADGVVTWEGAEEALAHAAKVVSTPETRAELAAMELSEARETAEPVAEVDAVRSRLDEFTARLEAVEDRTAALGSDLQALLDRDDDLYAVARAIARLTTEANRVQGTADELSMDIQEFGRWLSNPTVRYDELTEDVAQGEQSIEELAAVADGVEDALLAEGAADPDGEAARSWLDGVLQHRVLELLVEDLRAELTDIQKLSGDAPDRAAELRERLAEHEQRLATLGDRLDELALPAWTDRYADRIAEFEAVLADAEPPVDWGAVQAEQRAARPGASDPE